MVFLVEGRRQTLLYCYKWSRGQHFVLRQIAKTAANNSITARTRTLTRKEPWNKNGSKSTNHKLQTVTFWTLWNEHLLPKRYAKFRWLSGRHSKNHGSLAGGISISLGLRRSHLTTTQYRQLRRLSSAFLTALPFPQLCQACSLPSCWHFSLISP